MSECNSLEAVFPHEYPAGHLNHLSIEQSKALEDFKNICHESGYPVSSNDSIQASHDDEKLLRFLRARKFVPGDAFEQFKTTEEWRKDHDIYNWYNTIDVNQYEETRLLYTQWTGRRDRRGIPLYVFNIGGLDTKKLSQAESGAGNPEGHGKLSPKLRRLFATYEHLTNFVFPLCSSIPSQPFPETPISQTCNIVDISGVGIRQFWSLKSHLQDASTLATAHYPETLGRTFIIGAPSFFPTIWSWIKHWFDPNTVSKIFILSQSEVKSTLEAHIEPSNLPRRYGGTLDWEFGQLPNMDAEILKTMEMENGATGIPMGPIRWMRNGDGKTFDAHALGTEAGKQRSEIIAHISTDVFVKRSCASSTEQAA